MIRGMPSRVHVDPGADAGAVGVKGQFSPGAMSRCAHTHFVLGP